MHQTLQSYDYDLADESRMLLYVLVGLAIILAVIFVIIFLWYCRVYRTIKDEELDGLVSSKVTPAEYEVLAHCHCPL